MQIVFFLIAAFITGIASIHNLGSGFVGEATWISFCLSCLTLLAWVAWIYIVISHSNKVRKSTIGISAFFILCMAGIGLYISWEALSKIAILGGIGFACGLFLGLPFAGFSKICAGLSFRRYLLIVPYILLIIAAWVIYRYVNKSGVATQYAEKQKLKQEKKILHREKVKSQENDEKQESAIVNDQNIVSEAENSQNLSTILKDIEVEPETEINYFSEDVTESIQERDKAVPDCCNEFDILKEIVPETEIKEDVETDAEDTIEPEDEEDNATVCTQKHYRKIRKDRRDKRNLEEGNPEDEIQYLN